MSSGNSTSALGGKGRAERSERGEGGGGKENKIDQGGENQNFNSHCSGRWWRGRF